MSFALILVDHKLRCGPYRIDSKRPRLTLKSFPDRKIPYSLQVVGKMLYTQNENVISTLLFELRVLMFGVPTTTCTQNKVFHLLRSVITQSIFVSDGNFPSGNFKGAFGYGIIELMDFRYPMKTTDRITGTNCRDD